MYLYQQSKSGNQLLVSYKFDRASGRMYRKSVDYGQHTAIQVVQFCSFRRKAEQTAEITIKTHEYPQFDIKKAHNTLLLIFTIADLLLSSRAKNRRPHAKVFADFLIDNVPKLLYNYQHENTLDQLLACISAKAKDLLSVHDLVVNNTITQFVLQCFGRKVIKNYMGSLDPCSPVCLHGNEDDLLVDYNSEIRGQLLHMLALSFKIHVCVTFKDAGGQLEDTFKEYFGDRNSVARVEISDNGDFYRVTVIVEEEEAKLASISSSHTIIYGENKGRKEAAESLNTTVEGQSIRLDSRSANKEIRCVKCIAKGNCDCDRSSRKPIITRQLTTNLPTRSIFDSIGLGGPKRQTSTQEISANKRG